MELIAVDALATRAGDSIVGAGSAALRAVRTLAGGAPDLIAHERIALLAEVDRQRVATLRALDAERVALESTRKSEREALLVAVHDERIAVLRAADSVEQQSIDRAASRAASLAWEITVAALVVVAAGVVAGWMLIGHWRRSAPARQR